jgi:O-Antigen ligase
LERATKAAVVSSTLAALLFETAQAGQYQRGIPALAAACALAGWLAGRRWPERSAGAILAIGSLVPLLWIAITGRFGLWLLSPWAAALIAAAAPTFTASWQYPRPWRIPLIAWALAVALTWPIVALRELDWTPSVLWVSPSVYSTLVHSIPTAVWIAEVAQVHLIGLLWVDWLFGRFGGARDAGPRVFERTIVWPSVAAAIAGAVIATYQGFLQLGFLSRSRWAWLGRASGALADANASGALAALWIAIPIGLALSTSSRRTAALLTLGSSVMALGVWATGSRTALLGALIALLSGVHLMMTGGPLAGRRRAAILVAAVAVAITGAVLVWQPPATGPLRRISSLLPNLSTSTLRSAGWELWARNGYGLAAMAAIRDSPWHGVGIGTFHQLSPAYATVAIGRRLPHDNAQNWYRHQLAELGVLGSVGWAAWVVLFVGCLVRRRTTVVDRTRYLPAVYAVIGLGAASMLGMPGQSVQVALAFWTLAFWVILLSEPDSPQSTASGNRNGRSSWPLVAALGLSATLAASTLLAGTRDMRPPFRARGFDQGFRYGLHQPLQGRVGTTRTTAHAVEVARAPTKWMKLTVWVEHPDADDRPVAARVWRDRELIVDRRFPRGVPLTRYVAVPGENERFVLEATVDRTFKPTAKPRPEVGLSMSWEFLNEPPAGDRGDR